MTPGARIYRRCSVAASMTWRRSSPAVDEWLANNAATAAIIRPDRYAFALAADTTELETATKELARVLLTRKVGS